MTERYDVIVVGAGVLGCFAARELRRYGFSVLVAERESEVCTGISRANTGIIYPGYDMAPGSLKARLTVRSCRSFPELCGELGVKYRPCGSLMVGFGPQSESVICKKYRHGQENGVPGLQIIDGNSCREREPLLSDEISVGLFAPGTCTVNPWELGIAAYENAAANGAVFAFGEEIISLSRTDGGFLAETVNHTYSGRFLINAAGLTSDLVHEMLSRPSVRLRITAADYLLLEDGSGDALSHVIFHEPEQKGKGLTLVPTVDGNLMIGPTERDPAAHRAGNEWRYAEARHGDPAKRYPDAVPGDPTEESAFTLLQELCRQVVPSLDTSRILRSFGASRPRPYPSRPAETQDIRDFVILEEERFFSLIGIKTPGLTCAAALGEHLAGKIADIAGQTAPDPAFDPIRRRPVVLREMTFEQRRSLAEQDPAYGRILCSCRDVSAGEIRDAIRRGAVTLDGIKRRTGAMMGLCQGGRCLPEILRLLEEESGQTPETIKKGTSGSEVLTGSSYEIL